LLSYLFLAGGAAGASSTIVLDAGQLTSPASAPMQIDNTSPSSNGSLLLLIDLGPGNTLNNTLTPGNYVSGANTIIAAGGFNTEAGTNETLTVFQSVGTPNVGDQIVLRWFPQITFAQFQSGTVPAVGQYFGTYNPGGGNPDGGNPWIVPASGSVIDLHFFTTNSDGGGSQPPSLGFAGLPVTQSGTNPFSAWQSTYFSAQQLNEAAVSGPTATPQNDGIPNLLRYLFDINPTVPMSAADRAELPTVGTTTIGNTQYLTLTYRQYALETGITVNVQTSPDLQTWTTVTPGLSQQIGTDQATGDPIMEVGVTVPTNATKQFIRLDVTDP
jgi:hypothetical protein